MLSYVHNNHNVLQAVDPDCFSLEELLKTLLFCRTSFGQLEDVTLNSKQEIKTTPSAFISILFLKLSSLFFSFTCTIPYSLTCINRETNKKQQ